MRSIATLVVFIFSLVSVQPTHHSAEPVSESERLRIENAELKLQIASLELKVASLEKALQECREDAEEFGDPETARAGSWQNAIPLRIISIEPVGLLPSESDELRDLESTIQQLKADYDAATRRADQLEEENRRATRPYRTWDRKLYNPAPPNSPDSIREAKGKAARLRIEVRQSEQRVARLNRLKTTNRVLITGSHPEHESMIRPVLLSGKVAVDAMRLAPNRVIEVRLSPKPMAGSGDIVEGRDLRLVDSDEAADQGQDD